MKIQTRKTTIQSASVFRIIVTHLECRPIHVCFHERVIRPRPTPLIGHISTHAGKNTQTHTDVVFIYTGSYMHYQIPAIKKYNYSYTRAQTKHTRSSQHYMHGSSKGGRGDRLVCHAAICIHECM